MTDQTQTQNVAEGTATPEALVAERQKFWQFATRSITYVAAGLVVLLVLLWWFLV